jgi:pimeloyl-ACP methyl ester carboxylesterase
VHGLSSNARLWDQTTAHLAAAGYPSYAVDLRSHGDSDAPPDGYDTTTAAADLAALTERLGLIKAIVVGQSWGGNVVVQFAAKHPTAVGGLALIDGGWLNPRGEFPDWPSCAQALRPPDIDGRPASELRGYLRDAHPDWSAEAIAATEANLRIQDDRVYRRLPVAQHLSILRSMWDDPPQPYFGMLSMPVMLIPAMPAEGDAASDPRRSASARRERVHEAAAAIADAQIIEYVGADHDLHAQHPERLARDLLGLAERIGAG